MANDLTGDFDVVAEVSIPAVNRILAAMHRAERFLHSMAISVDDTPPRRPRDDRFSILARVDTFGDPVVDHTKIGTSVPVSGQLAATDSIFRALDSVVNPELIGATIGPIVPSRLKGEAQLQLSPPTIDVADAPESNVAVRMQVMARYLAAPNTSPLAEFIRGELQLTAPVSQVTSQTANVINVDLKVDDVRISFSPAFSSTPLGDADLAAINLLIRNALKTSFLPSTNPLPPDVHYLQFTTLLGDSNAIAALFNMGDVSGNPASLTNIFLGAGDDFGFAVSKDFILGLLPNFGTEIRDHRGRLTIYVQTLEFRKGDMLYKLEGRVQITDRLAVGFTVEQVLTLKLVATREGGPLDTAQIETVGDVKVHIGDIPWFGGWARERRNEVIKSIQQTVRDKLNLDKNLGRFINSLVGFIHVRRPIDAADDPPRRRPPQVPQVQLAYTSVEIRSSGIVLHGSLAVLDWPPAHVEFMQISPGNHRGAIHTGPDYSALNSWIPGGIIRQYEWSYQGQAKPFRTDGNTFVLIQSDLGDFDGPALARAAPVFTPICLTVRGSRLPPSGPGPEQPVSATVCEVTSVPILNGLSGALARELPLVALTQPGPDGLVQVVGHASAPQDQPGGDTPNLIVHFADEQTASHLDLLTQALGESRRERAPTAILAVLTAHQLAKARHTEGVIYTEEQGGAWERVFGVKPARRPLTLIVGPKGDVLWQHEGELDSRTLADALHKVLVKSGPVRPSMLRLNLRIGRQAPNFLFENAPGRQLTLRKLEGRAVELIFWKSSSKPSIETVRDRQERARTAGAQGPAVIAIDDGETHDLAKRIAAEHGLSVTMVADPQRSISRAYGVNVWPTTVFIDEFGLVIEIRYGRFAGEQLAYPSRGKEAAVHGEGGV